VLGIDIRVVRAAWSVFLFALIVATAYAIRETLVVFVIALFFAYLLSPVVDFVAHRLPRSSPVLALAIVYLALTGLLIAAGVTIGTRLVDEATSLANRLPTFFQKPDWAYQVPLPTWLEPMRERIIGTIQREFETGGKDLIPYVTSAGSKLVSSIGILFFGVLVPILAFFFLKDGSELRENFVFNLTDNRQRTLVENILDDINTLLGQYIRALVILSLATFTAYMLFLWITGAPYFVLLAGIAAALEFIPVVGPLTAGIVIIIVTGVSGYTHLVWFLIFWPCYRMFQDYMLSPYLMSSGVELHPLLVLFGVLAGEQIAGIPGMFLSVPVIATLRVIFVRATRARRRRELAPDVVTT
jgi:predicted PurR-regulated permease PerM